MYDKGTDLYRSEDEVMRGIGINCLFRFCVAVASLGEFSTDI